MTADLRAATARRGSARSPTARDPAPGGTPGGRRKSPILGIGFANNILAPNFHFKPLVDLYRRRFAHHQHGSAEQAIVGLGGHAFIARRSQDAVSAFRPFFENNHIYGCQGVSRTTWPGPYECGQSTRSHRQDDELSHRLR
jgi:hypothetical protein